MRRRTFECFGLVIHGFDWRDIRSRVVDAAVHGGRTWIVTANPEILLAAKRDPSYWQTLREADLRLVDGIGLKLAGWLAGSLPKRLTGVDLADDLIFLAEVHAWSVALIGGKDGVADAAAWKLRREHPSLRVTAESGGTVDAQGVGDAAADEALHRLIL
ncbi:WecB/TagA/CpsF family glycosyltransferase, partial [Candidatus Uhrbacteria bacterium]|nr:WecB/TagA/CpsF family glycosyltransferase [Candidatus Uhrbacteria bacterium]